MTRYEVQHYTICDGWVNTWTMTDEDGTVRPEYFATPEQARAAIHQFIHDYNSDCDNEELHYELSEFRVHKVTT